MAIAGFEPSISAYTDMMLRAGHNYYSESDVREILIKVLVDMDIEDVDGLSTLKTLPDKSLVIKQSEKLIDEFMESGE